MTFLEFINFYFLPGLILGSIYAVGAIGITMVFGILRFAHLAHGDLATMGAFLALAAIGIFGVTHGWRYRLRWSVPQLWRSVWTRPSTTTCAPGRRFSR